MTKSFNIYSAQRFMHLMLALLVAIGVNVTLSAQQAQPPQSEPATVKSADVSDDELKNFVAAFIEVQEMRSELQKEMATVSNQAAAQQLQQKASTEMAEAVRSNDLEVARFNLLARSVSNDQELNARFQKAHQEIQKKAGGSE